MCVSVKSPLRPPAGPRPAWVRNLLIHLSKTMTRLGQACVGEPASGGRAGGLFGPQPFGGVEGCINDALIARTAAEVAGDRDADLLLGRIRIVFEEFEQRRQHARRAEAALEAVVVAERLLQRMHFLGARRDAFD